MLNHSYVQVCARTRFVHIAFCPMISDLEAFAGSLSPWGGDTLSVPARVRGSDRRWRIPHLLATLSSGWSGALRVDRGESCHKSAVTESIETSRALFVFRVRAIGGFLSSTTNSSGTSEKEWKGSARVPRAVVKRSRTRVLK